MNPNLRRFDLSEHLIHFTRRVDLLSDDVPDQFPSEWSPDTIVDDDWLSPFFLLRQIVRSRQLLSTWSLRGGRRTIYGRSPAVCFTEMPLAAFLEASTARAGRGEKCSPYAILLRKSELFRVGARPVIYGLSKTVSSDEEGGCRVLPGSALPSVEQYRYVAFEPSANGRLDWTHEREWRWANRSFLPFSEMNSPVEGSEQFAKWQRWREDRSRDRADEDGLTLDSGFLGHIGLVVKNERQSKLLLHDILRLIDRRLIASDLFTFVLRSEVLPPARQLRDPDKTAQIFADASIDIQACKNLDLPDTEKLLTDFDSEIREVAATPDDRQTPERGGCWLWVVDNTTPLARALIRQKRAFVAKSGRYLVNLPEIAGYSSLRTRETLTKTLAARIQRRFSTASTYYSVLNSEDPLGLPSYNDMLSDEIESIYYNYAHHHDDT